MFKGLRQLLLLVLVIIILFSSKGLMVSAQSDDYFESKIQSGLECGEIRPGHKDEVVDIPLELASSTNTEIEGLE